MPCYWFLSPSALRAGLPRHCVCTGRRVNHRIDGPRQQRHTGQTRTRARTMCWQALRQRPSSQAHTARSSSLALTTPLRHKARWRRCILRATSRTGRENLRTKSQKHCFRCPLGSKHVRTRARSRYCSRSTTSPYDCTAQLQGSGSSPDGIKTLTPEFWGRAGRAGMALTFSMPPLVRKQLLHALLEIKDAHKEGPLAANTQKETFFIGKVVP